MHKNRKNIRAAETELQISFQSYGVKVGVQTDSSDLLAEVEGILGEINPHGFEILDNPEVEHLYKIKSKKNNIVEIRKDKELLWSENKDYLSYLQSQIRLTIAEYAESRVFLHAGAVGWRGKAILLPAQSFSGKSSLVAELVKIGAFYYSDDFAVLDENGLVHPFHRQISLRGVVDKFTQVDYSIEELGGKLDETPIPVGMVLITRYNEEYKTPRIWKPEILSEGQGIMEVLAHTIPIRRNPEFSLKVLNKVSKHAIICRSQRGEAKEFANLLLNYFETKVI